MDGKNIASEGLRIAIFDVDGTLVQQNIGITFVKYLNRHKAIRFVPKCAVIFGFLLYKMRLADFSLAIRLGCWALAGLTLDDVREFAAACFKESIEPTLFKDGVQEIQRVKALRYKVILATGAHESIAAELGRFLIADGVVCTRSEIVGAKYSWRMLAPVPYKEGKRDLVAAIIKSLSLGEKPKTIVYTDEAKDLALLDLADECVAVNADDIIKAAVASRGGRIINFS